jgi:hypothetical protein
MNEDRFLSVPKSLFPVVPSFIRLKQSANKVPADAPDNCTAV